MMHATLKAHMWVSAQLRTLNSKGMFAFVVHRGDHERGGIMLKRAPLDGTAEVFERALDFDGNPVWRALGPGGTEPEADVDARIDKRLARDSDLWVVEVEDPVGNLVLDAPLERL